MKFMSEFFLLIFLTDSFEGINIISFKILEDFLIFQNFMEITLLWWNYIVEILKKKSVILKIKTWYV
jgi:hypothetical protein